MCSITSCRMETCKSPRKVFNAAYVLAAACLKERRSKFSRHDFTDPQLFACLVLREHQKKSYRGVVALLEDCPQWCADIGLKKVPDHNTLCCAFHRLIKPGVIERMLDLSVDAARQAMRKNKKKRRPKLQECSGALDSTMFETHHLSRHFKSAASKASENQPQKTWSRMPIGGVPSPSNGCPSSPWRCMRHRI